MHSTLNTQHTAHCTQHTTLSTPHPVLSREGTTHRHAGKDVLEEESAARRPLSGRLEARVVRLVRRVVRETRAVVYRGEDHVAGV